MRAETCNYRDGVMRAGWGGPLHSGGLIPRLILCVCVFVCVLVCVCVFCTWGQGDGRHWIISTETFKIHKLATVPSHLPLSCALIDSNTVMSFLCCSSRESMSVGSLSGQITFYFTLHLSGRSSDALTPSRFWPFVVASKRNNMFVTSTVCALSLCKHGAVLLE